MTTILVHPIQVSQWIHWAQEWRAASPWPNALAQNSCLAPAPHAHHQFPPPQARIFNFPTYTACISMIHRYTSVMYVCFLVNVFWEYTSDYSLVLFYSWCCSSSHGYTNELCWNETADYTLQYPLQFAHTCTRFTMCVCDCGFRGPNFRFVSWNVVMYSKPVGKSE